MQKSIYTALLFIAVFFISSCSKNIQKADLIILNANIWSGNINQPHASAMAILSDSIVGIGGNEEIQKFKSQSTQIMDANGGFIVPGFIDSHVHLISGGNSLLSVELRDANTKDEFIRRIAEYAKKLEPQQWITEGNWDHTLWGGDLPQKEWIDSISKNNPVFISRLDGHMALANSAAINFAGINKNTANISGGDIIRDADGNPTGVFKDNAMSLIYDKIPALTKSQKNKSLKEALKYFASNGVTSVHDVDGLSTSIGSFEEAQKLLEADELTVRIYAANPLSEWKKLSKMQFDNNKWLKIGCLKGFVDGSLGSHTAAFKEPYTDKKDDSGFFVNSKEDLYEWISGADKANLQIMVHAIGDSAIHTLLDIYDQIISENGKKDRRLRIEHAQHISPNDIKRFSELGVIASMQPYHAIDDGRWAENLIGPERIKTTYAFNSLINSGAILSFGSDWAVAPASPIMGIYAAVTRQTLDGKNPSGWVPEQKISVDQALTTYTKNAAYASFEENIKGTLEIGKLADFVLLNQDLIKIEPSKIKDAKVLQTYVGGKKVFDIMDSGH